MDTGSQAEKQNKEALLDQLDRSELLTRPRTVSPEGRSDLLHHRSKYMGFREQSRWASAGHHAGSR